MVAFNVKLEKGKDAGIQLCFKHIFQEAHRTADWAIVWYGKMKWNGIKE